MVCVLVVFIFLKTTTALCFGAMLMMIIFSLMMSLIYHVYHTTNSVTIIELIFLFDDEFLIGLLLCS